MYSTATRFLNQSYAITVNALQTLSLSKFIILNGLINHLEFWFFPSIINITLSSFRYYNSYNFRLCPTYITILRLPYHGHSLKKLITLLLLHLPQELFICFSLMIKKFSLLNIFLKISSVKIVSYLNKSKTCQLFLLVIIW